MLMVAAMRQIVYGGMRDTQSRIRSRLAESLAAENSVVVIRPKICDRSDQKEAELRAAGIPFLSLNPIDHLNQVVMAMQWLVASGATACPTPAIIVNGTALCTNDMREVRIFLRYRN
jgi:hypothetical protein